MGRFLPPRCFDDVIAVMECVLAVLALGIPAVHMVANTLFFKGEHDDNLHNARDDLFAAWRVAGVDL
ncbi:hypothetical protein OG232_04595 [Streptomyces sp. NBC_01411]|uniref:hypothetical protein n=1 Tax=Streptomyces sp. NBC_01411 TaxID=2903857 RepID=UPI00324D5957